MEVAVESAREARLEESADALWHQNVLSLNRFSWSITALKQGLLEARKTLVHLYHHS